jgi:hypothetical protein
LDCWLSPLSCGLDIPAFEPDDGGVEEGDDGVPTGLSVLFAPPENMGGSPLPSVEGGGSTNESSPDVTPRICGLGLAEPTSVPPPPPPPP